MVLVSDPFVIVVCTCNLTIVYWDLHVWNEWRCELYSKRKGGWLGEDEVWSGPGDALIITSNSRWARWDWDDWWDDKRQLILLQFWTTDGEAKHPLCRLMSTLLFYYSCALLWLVHDSVERLTDIVKWTHCTSSIMSTDTLWKCCILSLFNVGKIWTIDWWLSSQKS